MVQQEWVCSARQNTLVPLGRGWWSGGTAARAASGWALEALASRASPIGMSLGSVPRWGFATLLQS